MVPCFPNSKINRKISTESSEDLKKKDQMRCRCNQTCAVSKNSSSFVLEESAEAAPCMLSFNQGILQIFSLIICEYSWKALTVLLSN